MNKIILTAWIVAAASLAGAGFAYQVMGDGGAAASVNETAAVTTDVPQMIKIGSATTAAAASYSKSGSSADLTAAKAACQAKDFEKLFGLMASSPAVLEAYSLDTINEGINSGTGGQWVENTRIIPRAQYKDFPVYWMKNGTINEYVYAPTAIVNGAFNAKPDLLDVSFTEAPTGGWSVEWKQMRYAHSFGEEEGESEYAAPVEGSEYGNSGDLYFAPTKNCWALHTSKIFTK